MSVLVRLANKQEDGRYLVEAYHPNPELLNKDEWTNTVLVDVIPDMERRKGKMGKYLYNPATEQVEIEYEDRPMPLEEVYQEMEDIKERLGRLEKRVG